MDTIARPPDMAPHEWFYATHGERKGPVTESQLYEMIEAGVVTRHSLVWHQGLEAWTSAATAGLKFVSPPPLEGLAVSDGIAWVVAFVPLVGLPALRAVQLNGVWPWIVLPILNSILCYVDEQNIKRAGHDTSVLGIWWLFFIPVYLWKRSRLLKQSEAYFWVCIGSLVVSLLL